MFRTILKTGYLCARGVWLKACVHSRRGAAIPATVQRLLVITDGRLGDLCLTIPVLQCLREAYPQAHFAVVVPSTLHQLVHWACRPDAVIDPGSGNWKRQSWDIAIDLSTDYYLKPAQIAFRSGAGIRLGFDYKSRGAYFTHPLPAPPPTEHAQVTYTRILAPLGISFRRFALPRLESSQPGHSIAIHPGAHHPTQRWPDEFFVKLIRRIQQQGETCVVLGSSRERELAGHIAAEAGPGTTAAISDNVMELAKQIRQSPLLICNNSGPLHLAELLEVPTLSFMGPTVKERWWPLLPSSVVLRRDELPCIGCNLGYCKIATHACMKEIRPDEAFSAYLKLRETLLARSRS